MTIHNTADAWALAYADVDTPLGDYPTITQQVAQTVAAALTRGGVAPAGASDLVTEASTRAAADSGLSTRVARLEAAWVAVTTSTSFSQLATASGALVAGMTQTIGLIPAGHQADIEVAVPTLALPASTTVQVILQDATGTPVVLDAAEVSAGTGTVGAPLRLSGVIAAGATDLTNRVVRTWLLQTVGASSGNLKAAGGAPVRQRYRIR